MSPKPAIVLVHGAWGGAWIWRRVLGALRAAGHEVHAVTLSGDGERAHLRHRGIGLDTHLADVQGLIAAEELGSLVLVGHSYGGLVITGVADRLLAAAAPQLRALVYIDAMVPLPGESWSSQHSAQVVAARLASAAVNEDALPPPDPKGFDLDAADCDWLARRHVPHPFGMYREPLDFDAGRWARLPRWFIDCTHPAYPTLAPMRRRVREQPGWVLREIQTGHFPMLSRPAELAAMLIEAAATGAVEK